MTYNLHTTHAELKLPTFQGWIMQPSEAFCANIFVIVPEIFVGQVELDVEAPARVHDMY